MVNFMAFNPFKTFKTFLSRITQGKQTLVVQIEALNLINEVNKSLEQFNQKKNPSVKKLLNIKEFYTQFNVILNKVFNDNYKSNKLEIQQQLEKLKKNSEIGQFNKLIKDSLNELSNEEKKQFFDLFSPQNQSKRTDLFDALSQANTSLYPLNIDFINNKDAINSKGEHVFELIAKNSDNYKDSISKYYSGHHDQDLNEPAYQSHHNIHGVFSLSLNQEFKDFLFNKHAKSYNTNEDSKKILNFAMDNMGDHAKKSFKNKIDSFSEISL